MNTLSLFPASAAGPELKPEHPATGRVFAASVALAPPEGASGVHITKLASDTLHDAVIDLFETLAIDERDVLYLDPQFDVTTLAQWELWRLDDNGNEVMMKTFGSRAKAVKHQKTYEARGHRQSYGCERRHDLRTDGRAFGERGSGI